MIGGWEGAGWAAAGRARRARCSIAPGGRVGGMVIVRTICWVTHPWRAWREKTGPRLRSGPRAKTGRLADRARSPSSIGPGRCQPLPRDRLDVAVKRIIEAADSVDDVEQELGEADEVCSLGDHGKPISYKLPALTLSGGEDARCGAFDARLARSFTCSTAGAHSGTRPGLTRSLAR